MALAPNAVALPPPAPESYQWLVTLKDIVDRLNLGVLQGNGTPEGIVFAGPGTLYRRLDGGVNTSLYVKQSAATLATGWGAK